MADRRQTNQARNRRTGQRLAPEERIRQILASAAEVFAERGFAASTRELARRLGITQALLYRYFESKDALIEQVLAERFLERRDPGLG